MSGAEEFCQHDFFYLPTSLRTGMVFPRVQDTLQLAMSEVEGCRKACLDGTIYSGIGIARLRPSNAVGKGRK